ncbi:hypothetical protein EYF80_008403 [Liparis tanakae]|uniref:Uncharacterized protein n=1 Tax=Liparis tanakae TaxID=230148 RepID=A0A4Z2IUD0_9TELE|nr:hypothetical protein EYF80_008403 [Liparis tanakae]
MDDAPVQQTIDKNIHQGNSDIATRPEPSGEADGSATGHEKKNDFLLITAVTAHLQKSSNLKVRTNNQQRSRLDQMIFCPGFCK